MEQDGFSEDFVQMESNYDSDSFAMLNAFETDITLPKVERTAKYITSEYSIQRLVNMKHLGDVCLHNDFNEIKEKIFPLFDSFLSEEEKEIRIEFANQLPSIAQVQKHSNVTSTLLGM